MMPFLPPIIYFLVFKIFPDLFAHSKKYPFIGRHSYLPRKYIQSLSKVSDKSGSMQCFAFKSRHQSIRSFILNPWSHDMHLHSATIPVSTCKCICSHIRIKVTVDMLLICTEGAQNVHNSLKRYFCN